MLKVELINKLIYETGGRNVSCWLSLPATNEQILQAMETIGVMYNDETLISNFETDMVGLKIDPEDTIDKLNAQIRKFEENFSDFDQMAVKAIIEAIGCNLKHALDIVESGEYEFYVGFNSLEEVAREWIEFGVFGNPKDVYNKGIPAYTIHEHLSTCLKIMGWTITSLGAVQVH